MTTAAKLWGRVLVYLRQNGFMALYSMAEGAKPKSLENNILTVLHLNGRYADALNQGENKEMIEKALLKLEMQTIRFKAELEMQPKTEIDINKLTELFENKLKIV